MARNRTHRIPLDELEEGIHNRLDQEAGDQPEVDLPPKVPQSEDALQLGDTVSALSMAIKKLKGQLYRLVGANDVLESEVAHARRRAIDLTKERDGLKKVLEERVKRLEEQLDDTVAQRDKFKDELVESRNAMEEIRQSILAAGQESLKGR